MKLIETYALNTGSKISRPDIQRNFYPLPFDRYITIQNSSGMESKNYSYWEDVLKLVRGLFDAKDIGLVQIGSKDSAPINGALNLLGHTSLYQTAYLIEHARLHIGNDSFACHMAGAFGVPLVSVYGATTVANHSPYFYEEDKTFLLEADRSKKKASFSTKEEVKAVDSIKPEVVADAIFRALGEVPNIGHKSLFFGDAYPTRIFEFVPDSVINPNAFKNSLLNVRMDYHFNEEILARTLMSHKCNILTDKPLDLNILLRFKQSVQSVSYEVDDTTDVGYIESLQKLGVKVDLVANEKCDLSAIRFKFLDHEVNPKESFDKESIDLSDGLCYNDLKFRTEKFIFSKGKIFTSHPHWERGLSVRSFDSNEMSVIDTPKFWEDAQFLYIYL